MRYFAYGSNLHAADLSRYCAANGFASLAPIGRRAYLPDYRPAFHYYSTSRQGGALDATPSRGDVCPGALFELLPAQVAVLDAKESAGVNYERREVMACVDGELISAFTYCVREEQRRGFVPPSAEYLNIVLGGYASFGFDEQPLLCAAEGRRPEPVRRIFVYGTLMRGESRHHIVRTHGCVVTPTRLTGMRLMDLAEYGDYPGMRPDPRAEDAVVHGEVHTFDATRMPALLGQLDDVEDFFGFEDLRSPAPRSMYERTLCEVQGELAWTYVLRPSYEGAWIESGDWRQR